MPRRGTRVLEENESAPPESEGNGRVEENEANHDNEEDAEEDNGDVEADLDAYDDPEKRKVLVGDFKPGSISRIELTNFLTHANVVITPGPRLNIVVGANGTGKSTILNAICLGLAGDPKLLGRADDLREFIMHEKDKAVIQITLTPHDESAPTVIRRVIDRNRGSEKGRGRGASTFYLNEEKATIQQVREVVHNQFCISIDNLCTFLPQDKVGSFSALSDQDRLLETEKTLLPNQQLFDLHQKLIEMEREMANSHADVETARQELKKLKHENEKLEREKERLEERQRAERQADLLKKKHLWLEFETMRNQAAEAKEEKDQIKKKCIAVRAELEPLQTKYDEYAAIKKQLDERYKGLEQNIQRFQKEMEKQKKKFETHDDEIENITASVFELDSKRSSLQNAYNEAEERLAGYKESLSKLPSEEQLDKELAEASQEMKKSRREYDNAKREERMHLDRMRDLEENVSNEQNRLTQLEDESGRRRDRIFRQHNDLARAYEWLERNRKEFRHPVLGPIVCEVTTRTPQTAAFLESQVPGRILKSFVVQCKADYDRFYNTVRKNQGIPINVIVIEGETRNLKTLYSQRKLDSLKSDHGILGFLDEFVIAPDPIKEAIRKFANVDRVLVGTEKTEDSINSQGLLDYLSEPDAELNQTEKQPASIFSVRGNQFFRYTQNVSEYSKQVVSRMDQIGDARMLAPGVDPQMKENIERRLENAHKELHDFRATMLDIQKKAGELEKEAQEWMQTAKERKMAKEQRLQMKDRVRRQEAKLKDAADALNSNDHLEKRKLKKSLKNRSLHLVSALEVHRELQQKLMESTIACAGVTALRHKASADERLAKQALEEKKADYNTLAKEAETINKKFSDLKRRAIAYRDKAVQAAPLEENGQPTALQAELEALNVETLAEVEAALEEVQQILDRIHANPDILRQYQQRKREIAELESSLESLSASKDKKLKVVDDKRKVWENALETSLGKVNALFSEYMSEMNCAGEVRLKKAEVADDGAEGSKTMGNFKAWGIEILVSFRNNTKAQVLSAERHSGGERSVSTIMYLMALQDRMVAPFRCVDEINQGLDERNERLVFRRIVKNSTRRPKNGNPTDHSGQYFLITPKLLPNLTDMEEEGVTILFVFNGRHSFASPTDWSLESLMAGAMHRKRNASSQDINEDENGEVLGADENARPNKQSRS